MKKIILAITVAIPTNYPWVNMQGERPNSMSIEKYLNKYLCGDRYFYS
jgi:hypothetical protein